MICSLLCVDLQNKTKCSEYDDDDRFGSNLFILSLK